MKDVLEKFILKYNLFLINIQVNTQVFKQTAFQLEHLMCNFLVIFYKTIFYFFIFLLFLLCLLKNSVLKIKTAPLLFSLTLII